jgi:hypothetical protein
MRKSLLFIALCALTFSCTEDFPENQSAQDSTTPSLKIMSLTENDAKQKFAEILSKAIYENIDLRSFIKDKAIQQFDNDFDVFYPILKNEEVGNSETFRGTLTLNFYDAIIVEKNSQKGYRPKNVSNGTVSITISPMSDAFSRSVNF